jgi:large subunit ribosomal protein L9|tara:strand:+ start:8398 stop:8838 length:441 start_codon:yes stop_codon:yes gene_type:complete
MQIILLESIDRVGKAGEVVIVKDGYANNFLFPKKFAIAANKKNKANLESKLVHISQQNDKKITEANSLKTLLDNLELTMSVEANDEDGLYGAITQKQVSDLLKAQGHSILNENIVLGEIKSIGSFDITIKIYEDIMSVIKLSLSKR